MRCRAVCSAFSGQVQSGVGAFNILWRYERKQPWFDISTIPIRLPGVGRDKLDFFFPFVNFMIFYLFNVVNNMFICCVVNRHCFTCGIVVYIV